MTVAAEALDSGLGDLERRVMAAVKASEERGDPPLARAVELGRCVQEKGLGFPSPELGQVLVSNLCFSYNTPSLWKLLDQAMASRLIYPLHTLALLTHRVIPSRRAQPEAYRLYLELLSRYALSLPLVEAGPCRDKIRYLSTDPISAIRNRWKKPSRIAMQPHSRSASMVSPHGAPSPDQFYRSTSFTSEPLMADLGRSDRPFFFHSFGHSRRPDDKLWRKTRQCGKFGSDRALTALNLSI
ncbi:hypothetical protein COCNU_04G012160 [Cocos nucifera]|uniref:Uncharacterized protein n=1 Tax=Cocos nucifera TaxID=13894 RepID=A0A8K0I6P8_COCNU|nr:hypothetical protein COCNU_04G012160 [Cocos nucifera]